MQEKCTEHDDVVLAVCFHQDCTQPFLCKSCFKDHPDAHGPTTKDITFFIQNENWIEINEQQRDSKVSQIEEVLEQKAGLAENKVILESGINLMKTCLEEKQSEWMKELQQLNQDPATQEVFSRLEEELKAYKSIDFRAGNLFERINQIKSFNDRLATMVQLINKAENSISNSKIDKQKIEKHNKELVQLLKNISLKDLTKESPFKSLISTEKMVSLEKEYEQLKQEKNNEIESLTKKIQGFQSRVTELQSQVATLKNKNDEAHSLPVLSWGDDSKIVNAEHFSKLEEWVPKILVDTKLRKYKLVLLYRATRDGFTSKDFYHKCGRRSPIISFIETKESGNIFGGYTSKSWVGQNGFQEDNQAFLFSLTHGEKYPCKDPKHAFYVGASNTLQFGGGGDIRILDGSSSSAISYTNFPCMYSCPKFFDHNAPGAKSYLGGSEKFTVREIEVYEVCLM